MKHIGMEYQEIDACRKDHVIYHKEQKYETKCPKFHMRQYQDDHVTKKIPHKVLHYITIILHLK